MTRTPPRRQAEDAEFGPSTYARGAGLVVQAAHRPALPWPKAGTRPQLGRSDFPSDLDTEQQTARVDLAQEGLPARLPSTACAPGPAREPRQAGVLQQLPPAPRRAVTSATFLSLAVSESLLLPWDAVRGPRSKVHGHGPEHVVFKSSSQEGHAARSEF